VYDNEPAVLVVDATMLDQVEALRRLPRHVVLVAADERSERALDGLCPLSLVGVDRPEARHRLLAAARELSCTRLKGTRRHRRLATLNRELRELSDLGKALMLERDQEELLHQILALGKWATASDGGGILLAEPEGISARQLRVAHVDFDSIENIPNNPRLIPVDDRSIVGHAARTKKPVVITDAYHLPAESCFVMDRAFDEEHTYRRRSMLIVPMVDHLDHLVGVLLFVNRKSEPGARITSKEAADRYVLPYTNREVRLARSLAGQGAVSIENARLYARIERTLESVVKAAVTAIDQRDPSTAGHSMRVAALSTELAKAVEHAGRPPYDDVRFSHKQLRELRFAALLHDFGKVTVQENVLLKAKKLPPTLWERVDARFDLIHRTLELEHCSNGHAARLPEALAEIDHMRAIVRAANEPAVLDRAPPAELADIARRTFPMPNGSVEPYLTAEELCYLQLPKGTLDNRERAEIESHVEETYRFLANIPWTDDLRNVANYARGHHEKLDGSGYPRRLTAPDIPIQTRIITVSDIFDALTEPDRPYKPSVPAEKALDILRGEAKAGRIDGTLVDIMIESQAYRKVLGEDWRQF
jgi:HD-GYP domain-containing protein (c-di-GMP phosphodiesterase class II)